MAKKKKQVNISGISFTNDSGVEKAISTITETASYNNPQKEEQNYSQYPESGVKYAGFYKRKINATTWELKPQKRIILTNYITAGTFGALLALPPKTTLYITDMNITFIGTVAPSVQALILNDSITSAVGAPLIFSSNGNDSLNLHFEVPIQLNVGLYYILAWSQDFTYSICGWEE